MYLFSCGLHTLIHHFCVLILTTACARRVSVWNTLHKHAGNLEKQVSEEKWCNPLQIFFTTLCSSGVQSCYFLSHASSHTCIHMSASVQGCRPFFFFFFTFVSDGRVTDRRACARACPSHQMSIKSEPIQKIHLSYWQYRLNPPPREH